MRKSQGRRSLLKIRATPLVRMPKSVFLRKIEEACHSGTIPDDIELTTLNWGAGTGRRWRAGDTLDASDAQELQNCYAMLVDPKTTVRVERPDK